MWDLVGNPKDRYFLVAAQLYETFKPFQPSYDPDRCCIEAGTVPTPHYIHFFCGDFVIKVFLQDFSGIFKKNRCQLKVKEYEHRTCLLPHGGLSRKCV